MYSPTQAFPVLPSSFYGTVRLDGVNVAPGTSIKALIENQVYADGETLLYEGHSVYSLTVPGDDSDTPEVDGGREGEQILFEIGGVVADQTGAWHSGTNVELNLTAATSLDPSDPENTPPPSEHQQTSTSMPLLTSIPTEQAEDQVQAPATATAVPPSSLQASSIPDQVAESMIETALAENGNPNLSGTQEKPEDFQPDIDNSEIPAEPLAADSQGSTSWLLSPLGILLGIGAVVIVVGLVFWMRSKWM